MPLTVAAYADDVNIFISEQADVSFLKEGKKPILEHISHFHPKSGTHQSHFNLVFTFFFPPVNLTGAMWWDRVCSSIK